MTVSINKGLRQLQSEMRTIEKSNRATISLSDLGAGLRELARPLATGCSSSVSVKDLKKALSTIGKEIRQADTNKDGQLNAREQAKLSPLAARLLQKAVKDADKEPSTGG